MSFIGRVSEVQYNPGGTARVTIVIRDGRAPAVNSLVESSEVDWVMPRLEHRYVPGVTQLDSLPWIETTDGVIVETTAGPLWIKVKR